MFDQNEKSHCKLFIYNDLLSVLVNWLALIVEQKAIPQKSLERSEDLFNTLLQNAFKGELV